MSQSPHHLQNDIRGVIHVEWDDKPYHNMPLHTAKLT